MTAILLAATAICAHASGAPVERVIVQPMAAPKPALKYQLLPEVHELKPGNAAQWYLRCFMEQQYFFFRKEGVAQRLRYQAMTLQELAREAQENYGGSALTQADWGARLETVDWQMLERVQTERPGLRLPELEPLHALAVSLQIRLRMEIARGAFDKAVGTAKTMFALARHLGEYPTSAAAKLALQVANLALDSLWEMAQQPNAPNLYWALTDLPAPLVDLRRGVQGDRALADNELRAFRDDRAMTATELDDLVGRLSGRAGYARERAGLPPRNLRAALAARAKDATAVGAARERLLESGLGKNAVGSFPALQTILLDDRRTYEISRDEQFKLLGLTPTEWGAVANDTKDDGLFADLVPPVLDLCRERARFEQRAALLRHVEALRLFAASNGGKLPTALTQVRVPLPSDPFTGKPFACELDAEAARLRGAAPKGEEHNPRFNLNVEVVIGAPESPRTQDRPRKPVKK